MRNQTAHPTIQPYSQATNQATMDLIDRNRNINRGFRKLIVWKEAVNFYVFVNDKLETLKNITFKVKGQIDDSAFSVHSNIAEGYARRSLKEHINFNNYALSSMAENYSQLFTLLTAKKIDRNWFDDYDKVHYSLENKLLAYNRNLIKKLNAGEQWHDDYIARDEEIPYLDE